MKTPQWKMATSSTTSSRPPTAVFALDASGGVAAWNKQDSAILVAELERSKQTDRLQADRLYAILR